MIINKPAVTVITDEDLKKTVYDLLSDYKKGISADGMFSVIKPIVRTISKEKLVDILLLLRLERKVESYRGIYITRSNKITLDMKELSETIEEETKFKFGVTRGRFDSRSNSITVAVVYAFYFFRNHALSNNDVYNIVSSGYKSAVGIRSAILSLLKQKPFPYIERCGQNRQGRPLFKWSGAYGYPMSIQREQDGYLIERTSLENNVVNPQYPTVVVDDFVKRFSDITCRFTEWSNENKNNDAVKFAGEFLKTLNDFKNSLEGK